MGFSLTKSKNRSVVGLDIESGFLAAAELGNGNGRVLRRAATEPLLPGLFHEGEVTDAEGLAEQLKHFFAEHKLPKRVRLGLASQRVALRVLELPLIEDPQELNAAVRFQAQEELPMPLEQAVLDHRVLERYTDGDSSRMRVLVVGARRDSVDRLLSATRRAGLVPELVDLSAFAMIRALYVPPADVSDAMAGDPLEVDPKLDHDLVDTMGNGFEAGDPTAPEAEVGPVDGEFAGEPGAANGFGDAGDPDGGELGGEAELGESPEHVAGVEVGEIDLPAHTEAAEETISSRADLGTAVMYCYIGGGTNLAIAVGTNCVFNRVLPNGVESMAATLAERRGLTLDHARQWLRHVGLDRDLDTIEGERELVKEARTVLERGAGRIADDVRLSLEYYQAAVSDARRVERMVMAGPGIALEGLPHAVEAQLGLPVVPRSLGSIEVNPGALDGVDASQLTVAAGLALDEVSS
jgi:Tfp pilus assembly PilM family ATPase